MGVQVRQRNNRKLWARCHAQDIQERLCTSSTRASNSGSSWDLALSALLGAQSQPTPHLLCVSRRDFEFGGAA